MNKLYLLLLLCVQNSALFARDNFSVSASYGRGWGFARKAESYSGFTGSNWTYAAGHTQRFDLGVSYRVRHFVIQSGLGYMVSSYTRSTIDRYYYQTQQFNNLTGNGNLGIVYNDGPVARQTFFYPSILLPVLLGYQGQIAPKLTANVSAGFCVSRNMASSMKFDEDTIHHTDHLTDDHFYNGYQRTTWWATAQGSFNYEFAPHFSVFCGPRFSWMLSNFAKDYMQNFEGSEFKLHTFTINAGLSWQPGRKKQDQTVR